MKYFRPVFFHTVIILLLCSSFGVVQPGMTGFYCDDRTIQRPYTGDTVSPYYLGFVVIIIPLLAMFLVESVPALTSPLTPRIGWKRALRIFYKYVVGLLLVAVIMELLKTYFGELRPHFIATCMPNVTVEKCSGQFVSNYVCTNNNATSLQILDSRKSFPSGHAAGACFTGLFLAMYIQVRMRWGPWMLRSWIQTMIMAWAVFCSVSRIIDFRHHWWDVLFGSILGLSGALYTVFFLCNKFHKISPVAPSTDDSKREVQFMTSSNSSQGCDVQENTPGTKQ